MRNCGGSGFGSGHVSVQTCLDSGSGVVILSRLRSRLVWMVRVSRHGRVRSTKVNSGQPVNCRVNWSNTRSGKVNVTKLV
ncbi:hypothetical protein Hanom_Chr03g00232921 [Helianthus anomalus]